MMDYTVVHNPQPKQARGFVFTGDYRHLGCLKEEDRKRLPKLSHITSPLGVLNSAKCSELLSCVCRIVFNSRLRINGHCFCF